jgi:hypothetical protein
MVVFDLTDCPEIVIGVEKGLGLFALPFAVRAAAAAFLRRAILHLLQQIPLHLCAVVQWCVGQRL